MINDSINVTGEVNILVTDKDGNIKDKKHIPNLVVTAGKNHIAARISGLLSGAGAEGAIISHMAYGIGTIAPAITDINLVSTLGARRVITGISHTAATNTVTITANFTGSSGNITEAGLFNALTGGTMICRTTFGSSPVVVSDTLTITWTIKIN